MVMLLTLPEDELVFEPELEVEPPAEVPELAGAPEPVVRVEVEPAGAGVSLPAVAEVAAFADIIKEDSRDQEAKSQTEARVAETKRV